MDKSLPVGMASFEALREQNMVYVDKTCQIEKLALIRGGKFFLARPRRFGKSLLISTFESLFAHGLQYFEGLAVAKTWKDRTYNVLRLDFSQSASSRTEAEFLEFSAGMFREAFAKAGLVLPEEVDWAEDPFGAFALFLVKQPIGSLVLLIDEYDAPLSALLDNPSVFEAVRDRLANFYSKIKSYDGCLRFLFITGILRFQHASLFSVLNPVTDISFKTGFGTLLGYTKEEIERDFEPWLREAERALAMNRPQLLRRLAQQYDGYCFDQEAQTHVFTPWSVLQFLADPGSGFQNYWYESGGTPTVLQNYIKTHSLGSPEDYEAEREVALSDLRSANAVETLDDDILLTQTGYFTIKTVEDSEAVLGYPNREVAQAMARLYSDTILRGQSVGKLSGKHLGKWLGCGDVESVVTGFNKLFAGVDYANFPVRSEAACRVCLQMFLDGAGLNPRIEVHSSRGRSDLEVTAGAFHWVFEFKFARKSAEEKTLLEAAVRQLRDKHYGETASESHILRVALIFSEERRSFVLWQTA